MDRIARPSAAEAEIRKVLDSWAEAASAKDVERVVAHYAPEVVAYDAVMQLEFQGRDAYREHWKNCLEMCQGPMRFEIADPTIAAEGDVAFCHSLCRCGGIGPDGIEHVGWLRMTSCLRRRDGQWLVVHEHFSVPFDFESGKALMDLEPETVQQAGAA